MGNLVQYEPVDDSVFAEVEKGLDSGARSEIMKLKDGKNVVRFLPSMEKGVSPFLVVSEHFVELDGGDFVRFACPRAHGSGKDRCPKCEEADALKRTGNEADRKQARRVYPARRVYANVLDRAEQMVRVLALGTMLFEELKAIRDDKQDGGDFLDPGPRGFDVVIMRSGKGKGTRYKARPGRHNGPLSDDPKEAREWLKNQWPLDNFTKLTPPKELAKQLGGGGRDDDDDDGRGSRGRAVKARRRDEDEDDDDVVDAEIVKDEDEDEDEEDEKPRVRSARTVSTASARRSGRTVGEDVHSEDEEDDDDVPY